MAELSESVTRLIKELSKLPGIGKKSAERITYHVLRVKNDEALGLADAIRDVKQNVHYCKNCYNLAEDELCRICQDTTRDQSLLCVVEQPRDLMSLEMTDAYRGLYHVLLGNINPLDNVSANDLTIEPLIRRVKSGQFSELIMATNPTTEGDGTSLYITNRLENLPIQITRLARGITSGSVLEFANKEMLTDAIGRRQDVE